MLGEHVEGWDRLVARSPEEHTRRGIDVRIRTEVTAIDLAAREVHWRERDGGRDGVEAYDFLALTTGAHDRRPELPGLDLGFPVFTPRQAMRLGDALPPVQRALIVGGGYIGMEMAEAMRDRGAAVTLINRSGRLLRRTFDPDMSERVAAAAREIGVALELGAAATSITKQDGGCTVTTERGSFASDIAILGLGSAPSVDLAREAGVPLGETGAIAVDHGQRTSIPGVYAAGDCAEAWDLVAERWTNLHLGTIANKAGRVAGLNIGAESLAQQPVQSLPGVAGTTILRLGRHEISRTGLTMAEAAEAGIDVRAETIEGRQIAGYMPGSSPIHVKLIAETGSGRVVGGQIIGQQGAGKRIDVVATAVSLRLTVQQLVDLDLAYAPPFSRAWDPVQTAGRVLLP